MLVVECVGAGEVRNVTDRLRPDELFVRDGVLHGDLLPVFRRREE